MEAKVNGLEQEVNALRTSRFEAEQECAKMQGKVSDLEAEIDYMKTTLTQYDDVLTKKQKQDLLRKGVNHVPATPVCLVLS